MVFRHRVALVTALMLLVHNNQPQFIKRRKQCRARPYHNLYFAPFCPQELVVTLPCGQSGVHNGYSGPKPPVKTVHCLEGQCNLRYQYNCLLPLFYHMLNQIHINLGFPASRHTMDQVILPYPSVIFPADCIYNCLLLPIENRPAAAL